MRLGLTSYLCLGGITCTVAARVGVARNSAEIPGLSVIWQAAQNQTVRARLSQLLLR
jgi:hypothetical protein